MQFWSVTLDRRPRGPQPPAQYPGGAPYPPSPTLPTTKGCNRLRRIDLLHAAVGIDLHEPGAGLRRMDGQLQTATFDSLDDQIGLTAVSCAEGLGCTGQRRGHRVGIERAEIGEHFEAGRRRVRSPTAPLSIAVHEVLFDVAVLGADAAR